MVHWPLILWRYSFLWSHSYSGTPIFGSSMSWNMVDSTSSLFEPESEEIEVPRPSILIHHWLWVTLVTSISTNLGMPYTHIIMVLCPGEKKSPKEQSLEWAVNTFWLLQANCKGIWEGHCSPHHTPQDCDYPHIHMPLKFKRCIHFFKLGICKARVMCWSCNKTQGKWHVGCLLWLCGCVTAADLWGSPCNKHRGATVRTDIAFSRWLSWVRK